MTLQQLKYVVTVAETGTITEAANRLYISQPSLTNAIRELEKEMKITIFLRTNKGIILSKEGEDFLGYARQVLEQAAILKDKYKGTSGTNVVRDFVELPSQINEHWATEPEVLKMYAKHYATGKVIPDEIIEKILQQKTFNQGFMTTELLAAAILDMNLHMLKDVKNLDAVSYEKEAMDKLNLISEIAPRYRVTYFNHIIGGYAAGYYSYLWANVLDNDAFEAFKEHGIFDKNTAELFRRNVLEKGDSEDPMTLYKNFRGTEPSMEPLLKNRGMK